MPAAQIKGFVLQNFLFTEDQSALADDQSLVESGTLDSTGILELITFIEESFGIRVADDEMLPANFDSINAITAFVSRKKQAA